MFMTLPWEYFSLIAFMLTSHRKTLQKLLMKYNILNIISQKHLNYVVALETYICSLNKTIKHNV